MPSMCIVQGSPCINCACGEYGSVSQAEPVHGVCDLRVLTPMLHSRSPAVSVPSESVVERASSDRNFRSDVSKYSRNSGV